MAIKLERILTVSASEYVESVGKKLSDYNLIGVNVVRGFGDDIYQKLK